MLTFVHISDTHLSADMNYAPPWAPAWVKHPAYGAGLLMDRINALPFPIEFILHTGDLCADPLEADCHFAREWLLSLDAPVFVLPGNHDSADFMREIVDDGARLRVLGDDHVAIKSHHLLTLDTNGGGDDHAPTLSREQIDAFAARLDETNGEPIIVGMHHGVLESGIPYLDDKMRVQNGDRVHALLASRAGQIRGVFHGHIHQPIHLHGDGVSYFSVPSTWSNLAAFPGADDAIADREMPGGFNVVCLRGERVFIRRYAIPLPRR